jgi:hypothetical protein
MSQAIDASIVAEGDNITLLWESPMTPSEKAYKLALEAKSTAAAMGKFEKNLIMEQCLLDIYQQCLFRGDTGKRSWGDYLKSGEPKALGFGAMTTEAAGHRMMHAMIVPAIRTWNDKHPDKQLPMPASHSYMQGWERMFDRARAAGATSFAPWAENAVERAIKALYDGAIKKKVGAGMASREQFRAIGAAARADHGRDGLGGSSSEASNLPGPAESTKAAGPPTPTPGPVHGDYGQRTVDPAVLEAAERARAEREAAAERQALQDAEDREVGLDPRSLQTMEKPALDVVKEAETFATLTNALADSAQALEVWIRGKLNAYGSPFFDSMQEFALGINTAHGRLDQIRYADERLQRVILLLESDIEPGDLTNPNGYQQEPS